MYPVHRYGVTGDHRILYDDHPGGVGTEHLRPVDLAQTWISPEYQFAGVEEVLHEEHYIISSNCELEINLPRPRPELSC